MKVRFTQILILCAYAGLAQVKGDYVWITGNNSRSTPGIESYCLDFNKSYLDLDTCLSGLEFDSNNASICDENGNLLFYTNGCAIANRAHAIMENGDSINAGQYFDLLWEGDCANGYPGFEDILILSDPETQQGYYIIHKPRELVFDSDPQTFMRHLMYSYVDLSFNDGLGKVTEKNVSFFESDLLWSYLTAITHTNGRDWWIIQPKEAGNIYYTFLLDPQGFHLVHEQSIGPDFHWNASASGVAKFSPNGTQYAYFNEDDGLLLYDFDRGTGWLSNLRTTNIPTTEDDRFMGMEFSPNSRFIYLSAVDSLFQVDTWEENLDDGLVLIDTWNGVWDPLPTIFFLAQLAPDCKIYICSTSSTNTYHVIHKPDEKGAACDFVQQGVRLPHVSSVGNFPNFPRFRVDEESACDPNITSVFGETAFYRRDLHVYPNPVTGPVLIDIPENTSGQLLIFDATGQQVASKPIRSTVETETFDLSAMPAGTYHFEFIPKPNADRWIYTATVVTFH